VAADGLLVGADGRARCAWAGAAPDYVAYHDDEWGRPVRDDVGLFEKVCLEAFQSGLSWLTVLRKREAFRRAFAGFVPERVAAFTADDVERLLGDASIIRHRGKIEATITNGRAAAALRERDGDGALARLVWSFAPAPAARPASAAEVPAITPESTALAAALKAEGLRFVGPTTAYALMQACGLVDDHVAGCSVPPARPAPG
jgi:DNA-3-methyladenine glycosylase I